MTKLDPLAINNCTAVTDCTSTNDNNTSSESGISVGETTSSEVYAKGSKMKHILIQGVELIDFGIRMINKYLDDVDSSAYSSNEDKSIDELSDDNFIENLRTELITFMSDILLEADLHACPSPLPLRDKSVLPYHDVITKSSSNILSTMYNNTDGSIIIPNQIGLLEYDLHTPPRPMRLRDKVIITFDNTEGSIIIPSQNELLEYDLHSRPCPLRLQDKMVLSTNDVVANYNVNIS